MNQGRNKLGEAFAAVIVACIAILAVAGTVKLIQMWFA